ncbi:MAG TPA: LuxR C-terminal-related transcriptional regulator [Pyrinomonadaceae bacterium]|nr:LuxR C-terminal-related transcriptional regulator [Pyrinomonadaceae bacterium]
MVTKWLPDLVEGTADPAFAVDGQGLISAWNSAAEELFGLRFDEVLKRPCHEILQGSHEQGPFCSGQCSIHRALRVNRPLPNFDLKLETRTGKQWCNLTIEMVTAPESNERHAIHVVRPLDVQRLIEQLRRVMVTTQVPSESEAAAKLISSALAAAPNGRLTGREQEILEMLAQGKGTSKIAERLYISRATVNNHVQHIMEKLDAHSRLEVVARAREAGII